MITVLGKDRPGIISMVSNILYEQDCNLEDANQMILQKQFAGFLVDVNTNEDHTPAHNTKTGILNVSASSSLDTFVTYGGQNPDPIHSFKN